MATALAFSMALPSLSQAASMTGSLFMGATGSPSSHSSFDGTARKAVIYETPVTTGGTGTARTILFPAGLWDMSGTTMRIFPGFPSVAQSTEIFTSSHGTLTFGPGLGAGPVSWCPGVRSRRDVLTTLPAASRRASSA
ncbi:MAG: hypothetical protein CL908_18885 [Deltaproteobacteria bacterium]|nr:hypothetical protein [Deltaproteobacteria bacterium]